MDASGSRILYQSTGDAVSHLFRTHSWLWLWLEASRARAFLSSHSGWWSYDSHQRLQVGGSRSCGSLALSYLIWSLCSDQCLVLHGRLVCYLDLDLCPYNPRSWHTDSPQFSLSAVVTTLMWPFKTVMFLLSFHCLYVGVQLWCLGHGMSSFRHC